jgi:hypothetical protein
LIDKKFIWAQREAIHTLHTSKLRDWVTSVIQQIRAMKEFNYVDRKFNH